MFICIPNGRQFEKGVAGGGTMPLACNFNCYLHNWNIITLHGKRECTNLSQWQAVGGSKSDWAKRKIETGSESKRKRDTPCLTTRLARSQSFFSLSLSPSHLPYHTLSYRILHMEFIINWFVCMRVKPLTRSSCLSLLLSRFNDKAQ